MKYKAIGFDYGGVIGGVNTTGASFNEKVCKVLEIDEDTYKDVYFSLNYKINLGEVGTWKEFWTIFLDKLGKPEKLQQLILVSDEAAKNLLIIDPKMLPLVDRLRELGYKTGLLSNTTIERGQNMREQKLDNHFDVFHISAETKLMKPRPEAFRKLANDLDIQLSELIFVDDAEKSLSTAQKCGFTPILFKSHEDLVRRLQSLDIDV